MEIITGQAQKTVLDFFDAYLVQRDREKTLSCLTENVHWVGTGEQEFVSGIKGVRTFLEGELQTEQEGYRFIPDNLTEQVISDSAAVVMMAARMRKGEESAEIRVNAFCTIEKGKCRIASIHISKVGAKTLDLLGRSIPGGMMGGYAQEGFPLYFINRRMLSYLGYTYEEFVAATDGKVINCIYPEDRERVGRSIMDALEHDLEYALQYRIGKKDGTYVWVSDIGKRGVSEDGRVVCISVLRDISAEVEQKQKIEAEAEEKERQANRYNRLFESVLCGIVQYRLGGGLVFENANREAIRIFGYEPEEFWKKTDWDLPALIFEEDRERILQEIGELHKIGDKKSYEYRLRKKDGSYCWIIGSAEVIQGMEGQEMIQSVFLDIDARKKAELRNRLLINQVEASNEILRLALEHTTTCEFYYYPAERRCVMPKRAQTYYQTAPFYENMPEGFATECIPEEYRNGFYEMYDRIHQGERTASLEFPIREGSQWCQETISVISYSDDGSPLLAIGILEDVTRRKEMELALEETRSRDMLTGIYKKDAGIRLVQEALLKKKPEESCGMMLLDMDNFEAINREEGSAFADAVLQEVAAILIAEAGADGIQIRLGGDEFMLFVYNCDKARAAVLGQRIAEQVKNIMVHPEKSVQISVSIGMCVTEVVEEYNALYRCAESTLKYVKENGKGQAACYLDTSNELGIFLTQLYTEEHPVNAIDRESSNSEEDLVSFALELLGKSKKLEDAVFLLLARIGKNMGFDRVSILEASREFLSFRFSFQWARYRKNSQLGQEVYVEEKQFETISHLYDESGLSEENVRKSAEYFKSCLHAGIWDGGEFAGIMSFEVDEKEYEWTDKQKKLLKELVKIIPSFLMKAKADAISQAKTDFLSRMSHEIRTPMNAISGMTTIAKSVLDDRDKAMDCLMKIESANTYLLNLINDILDMSRIESGKMELNNDCMDIASHLESLESLMRPQAQEKGLELKFKNQYTGGRLLMGDGLRLNQVLINIIGNAIKFTDRGGKVWVRVEVVADSPRLCLKFSVKDTGIGIAPAALKRIFNAFEQADKTTASRHGGTGLGLAISSRLVQMMGGTLDVSSKIGEGSVFYFTVPFEYAEEGTAVVREVQPEKPVVHDFSGRRILLAEDNELNSEIARTVLLMNGFKVECALNGRQALDLFEANEPGYYDAILMDIRMPVMDGLEATRKIRTLGREDSRTVPIVALTANAFDEDSKKSLESGMNGHLSKPIQLEQLLDLLGKCMKERR